MQEVILLSINGAFFNNTESEIIYDNKNFKSLTFEVTNHLQNSNLQPDTFEVKAIFSEDFPDANTVQTVLKNTEVVVSSLVENQTTILITGVIFEISTKTSSFTFKVKSELYKLNTQITKKYSGKCRASFCDANCQLLIVNHTHTGIVEEKYSHSIILNEVLPTKEWRNGLVKINKNGKIILLSIRGVNNAEILFFDAIPSVITSGDVVSITASCNKTLKECSEIYNNAINFQGEPFIFREKS
jgi:uncharacterized phage protein (TIGR02218 family)